MSKTKIKRALIAVFDKTGIAEVARTLVEEFGIEILSTGGTARHLSQAGIPVTMVEEVTGSPEMLDGRVKTLHPMIHGALLADRDNPDHMRQLAEHAIEPIDMVVVNLYPFEKTIEKPDCTFEQAIEMIDIGGPCMLRSAAKNHKHVVVIPDPRFAHDVMTELREKGDVSQETRKVLAAEVFKTVAKYNTVINWYLSRDEGPLPSQLSKAFTLARKTRYGENPAQAAAAYRLVTPEKGEANLLDSMQTPETVDPLIHGQMSFNNYMDGDSALSLIKELTRASEALWHRRLAGENYWGTGVSPMNNLKPVSEELFTRRNLPHIQKPGKTYFVTFRIKEGELPQQARGLVLDACQYWHGKKMNLHIAIVMPDHVHLLLTPFIYEETGDAVSLGELLHSIKSYSAHQVNKLLGRSGPLWLDENWDRIVRNEREFTEKWEYIDTNPSRKGLSEQYPWILSSQTRFEETGYIKAHRRDAGATPKEEVQRRDAGATPKEEVQRRDAGATQEIYAVAFIKHTNACGCAIGPDPVEAYRRAYLGDPIAAAGGVLCMNFPVNRQIADVVMNSFKSWGKAAGSAFFKLDVWIAPSFDDEAVRLITTPTEKRKWGASCRLLAVGPMNTPPDQKELDYKKITGGMLIQQRDLIGLNQDQWKIVSKRPPTETELADLHFAWLICKHTKSNAITVCKDGMLLGNGAGQMSRVKSCDLAIQLARENGHTDKLDGAVAAGDAFFPVPDGPQKLIDAGITAIIHPGGSNRDQESIDVCDATNIAMIMTGTRHFKH
ncbi:MAG: bifunctional phosphoribosylaminoimidazolecarboxamide formyltransferase/inosine monophosphate cyclohydrolase [Planctomycetota bacterium]|jgi:AICAR transformylase/IMP cyclohydrolase PurH/REP element-mobilizing transposase RayT